MDNFKHVLDYLKSLTILYVEDEEVTYKVCCQILNHLVGTLITAKNGAQGLDAFFIHNPDIIITDIKMPVMDGLSMAREIRNSNKSVPIIVITSLDQADYVMESIDIGIDKYLAKPVKKDKLLEVMMSCTLPLMLKEQNKVAKEMLKDRWQDLIERVDSKMIRK